MQSFDTKNPNTLESFDRKFEGFDTFSTKESEVKQPDNDLVERSDPKLESFESKDTKVDGRSKPRTRKQIDAYKRNFGAGKVIERKIYELDKRVQHLQQFLLNICSNQLQLTDLI